MTFISYAQNFEDLMLHRALGDIENGFYVDVGAQHALRDSVTAAFYERGWSGINIEPIPKWARLLRRLRPRDINLEMAIHPTANEIEIHQVPGGLSTCVTSYAERYRDSGLLVVPRWVDAGRLDDVLAAHSGRDIHFLKIDVEGAEAQVLESISLGIHRPWIILVEATRPGTSDVVAGEWEHFVTQAGYRRVYWDGLNVFFVAVERMELTHAFSRPPNVFDKVQLAETVRTITRFARRAQIARRRTEQLQQRQLVSERQCKKMSSRISEIEGEILRVAELKNEVSRIAGLEREVARIAGLEQEVSRLVGLEREVSRMADVERESRDVLDRISAQEGQLRFLGEWASELVQQGQRSVILRRELYGELGLLRAQAARAGALEGELEKMRGTTSWLITAPLRLVASVARREIPPREAARRLARGGVRALWIRIRHRTTLAKRLQRVVAVQPRLHSWLQRAATHGEPTAADVAAPAMLGVRARAVYEALSGSRTQERL